MVSHTSRRSMTKLAQIAVLSATALLTFAGCASAQHTQPALGAEQSTGGRVVTTTSEAGICPPGPLESLQGCTLIAGDLVIERYEAPALPDLGSLRRIEGSLIVRQSPQLNHLEGLRNLEAVGGDLMLVGLPGLATLQGLQNLRVLARELHLVEVGVDACEVTRLLQGLRERGYQGRAQVLGVDASAQCPLDPESPALAGASPPGAPGADAVPPALNPTLPPISLPPTSEIRGGHHLETIHPEIALRARLLYALLEHEGIEVIFISGYRRWSPPGGRRLASWHHVGLSFDLNLTHRATMSEANRHYDQDKARWERIGELAEGLGIIWGARYDDIFHFEWHPGHHARMRQDEFDRFRSLAGRKLVDYRQTWELFEPERRDEFPGPPCFGGCFTPPDAGLAELLEALR
ncbi:hypothetical protein DL240_13100 [Lujinxingia litoralis]|uniref:Peptidase M15C domain-containing protein n=1 Tax=Lujinxingia litoralis TaxID=2211119 RepID=A0A328C6N3_9DELT|nr:M15 family metallopeptidase [Lujinxingia litoralis]RAL21783.1 hypothetical protein DL240_13100 [Lujinxingia litoralis]